MSKESHPPAQDIPYADRFWEVKSKYTTNVSSYHALLSTSQTLILPHFIRIANFIYSYISCIIQDKISRDIKIKSLKMQMASRLFNKRVSAKINSKFKINTFKYLKRGMLAYLFSRARMLEIVHNKPDERLTIHKYAPYYGARGVTEKRRYMYMIYPRQEGGKDYFLYTKDAIYVEPFGWIKVDHPIKQEHSRILYINLGFENNRLIVDLIKDTDYPYLNYIEYELKFPVGMFGELKKIFKDEITLDIWLSSCLRKRVISGRKAMKDYIINEYESRTVTVSLYRKNMNKYTSLPENELIELNSYVIWEAKRLLSGAQTTLYRKLSYDIEDML